MLDPRGDIELDEMMADLNRPLTRASTAPRSSQCDVLRPVDHGREVGRAALVGVKPRDQRAMRGSNGFLGGSRLKAKDLIGFLVTHFALARRRAVPRCRVELHVLTPAGRPAVQILSHEV